MTQEQAYQKAVKKYGDNEASERFQAYMEGLQDAEPQWIPIIDGDLSGVSDGVIWITYNLPDNTPFVSKQNGSWLKEMEAIFTAWMPYTKPKPYQP